MYGYIYETTNLVNGKKYIGQKKSPKFLGEKYLGSGVILRQAVNKYGKENFKVKLLCKCNKQETLDKKEKYYINKYRKTNIYLYNIAKGGNDFSNPFCTGKANHFYGKHHSTDVKNKISKSSKGKIWVNKNNKNKRINPNELDLYLQQGWKRGTYIKKSISKRVKRLFRDNPEYRYKCGNSTRGKFWVNKENIRKLILPSELDLYLQQGWKRGTGVNTYKINPNRKKPNHNGKNNPFYGKHHSKESIEKIKRATSSIKWKESHREKVSEGTKKALRNETIRKKMSDSAKKRFSNQQERKAQSERIRGFKWMTKDNTNIQVKPEHFEHYLSLGYYFGRKIIK